MWCWLLLTGSRPNLEGRGDSRVKHKLVNGGLQVNECEIKDGLPAC